MHVKYRFIPTLRADNALYVQKYEVCEKMKITDKIYKELLELYLILSSFIVLNYGLYQFIVGLSIYDTVDYLAMFLTALGGFMLFALFELFLENKKTNKK